MTYAIRNTLVIAAFWGLILAGGFYYVYGHQEKAIRILLKDNLNKRQRLQDLLSLEKDRSVLRERLAALENYRLSNMSTLAAQESPGETFDYLLRELGRTHSGLEINFVLKNQDSFLTLARRNYELEGSGSFSDFYQLLWFLENGPLFYNIHQLEMEIADAKAGLARTSRVQFKLAFNGYNRTEGPSITSITATPGELPSIANLVNGRPKQIISRGPRVAESVPAESAPQPKQPVVRTNTEGLPEIDQRSQVLAIMPGSAVLKDQSGRTVRLKPGDRVFGGTLSAIDTKLGTVYFSLQDESGGSTRLVLPAGSN